MAYANRLLALVALLCPMLAVSKPFHVCGNYCGPGYCNGKWLSEADCDDSVAPETHSITGPSCADSCCKMHDTCCGHGSDRSICNTKIVDCLGKCNVASLTCTLDGVPVPAGGIEAAMDIVEGWCCGSPCSTSNPRFPHNATKPLPKAVNGKKAEEL